MHIDLQPACRLPEEIGALFAEYTGMLLERAPEFRAYLELQHYGDEVKHLERKYGPPGGRLYLARADGRPAGCVGLRSIDGRACEMKRLYVRPEFRGRGAGGLLARQVIDDAREIGYTHMLLDTFPFLDSAIRMYRGLGFYEIAQYNDSPMKDAVYMRLEL